MGVAGDLLAGGQMMESNYPSLLSRIDEEK